MARRQVRIETQDYKPLTEEEEQVKLAAEQDLEYFIYLVQPVRVLGQCHKELIRWWTREDARSHQLVLLPRDHQKSTMLAFRVAWTIVNNPAIRILYISATSTLAVKQLKFIKDILTSEPVRRYWPELINPNEGKREKWTETEISVDHPRRKEEAIRDATIFTAGLTTTITGLHCDIACMDDVVVDDTAYTKEGREKVLVQASYLASIQGTEGRVWAVGTRYHPKDLYDTFQNTTYDVFDEDGNIIDSEPLYEIYEKKVEDRGDGTGNFIWPRQQDPKTQKWYGFNTSILARKKAQYYDQTKFRAQYYNDPNDLSESAFKPAWFQYYDPSHIAYNAGQVFFKTNRLNVVAAIDFAFSLSRKADYTCLVVLGIDAFNNYYVLDIDRFRTNKISDYFDRILRMHTKWGFRKIRAEVSVAQEIIVKDLKENYIKPNGLNLVVEEHRPLSRQGSKEERIISTLQPKYANLQMWHYSGGNCSLLEEELLLQNPPHDDIKDSLSSAVEIAIPPSASAGYFTVKRREQRQKLFNSRFGGIG